MPSRRDSGEDAVGEFVAAIFGLLAAFVAGVFLGKRAAKERAKAIEFSETLEIDVNKTYGTRTQTPKPKRSPKGTVSIPVRDRQPPPKTQELRFPLVAGLLAATVIGAGVFGLNLVRGRETMGIIVVLLASFFVALAAHVINSSFRARERQLLEGQLEKQLFKQSEIELQATEAENFEVEPLDFSQVKVYAITLPEDTEWQPQTAGRFMQDILQKLGGRLTFQIVAEKGRIVWRILDLGRMINPPSIKQAVHVFYPNAEIVDSELSQDEFTTPFHRYVAAFEQVAGFVLPILKVDELTKFDPLVNFTHEMSALELGERIIYTLFVADYAKFVYDQAEDLMSVKLPAFSLVEAGFDMASGGRREDRYEPNVQKLVEEKLLNFVCQCLLLIQVDAPSQERVTAISRLDSHLLQFKSLNFLVWHKEPWPDSIQYIDDASKVQTTSTLSLLDTWLTNIDRKWRDFRLLLDTRELASLWHLPHEGFTAANIDWLRGKRVPLPAALRGKTEGVCLGDNVYAGKKEPVYMLPKDRETHMIVVGRTGVGKSTFMHNLIHQDIQRGSGVAVIDPHGDLVRDVLHYSIPPERENQVVVWDLADIAYPPPLNLLAFPEGYSRVKAAVQITDVFSKLEEGFSKTRMASDLSMAFVALLVDKKPTIRDVARLFRDENYRWSLIEKLENDPANDPVYEFWSEFDGLSSNERQTRASYILSRLQRLYTNPILYPITCHPDPLDFSSLVSQEKIVLISLQQTQDAALDEREIELLGALLISQFQMAVMAKAATRPFYLYVDEAQRFTTTAIDEVFTEARKRNLSLTLANQHLGQLEGKTLEAVMENVGAMVSFQCGEKTARMIAPYMKPSFSVEDLLHLDMHQAALFMRYQGEQLPTFSLSTRPKPKEIDNPNIALDSEARIRRSSRSKYTKMTRDEIMKWLSQRYPRKGRPEKSQDRESAEGEGTDEFSEPL